MAINSVTGREIEELSPEQLTRLLQMLLHLEVQKKDLQGFYYVSQKITASDGGEDGRIMVTDTNKSNWIQSKLSLYQCKATNLTPSKVGNELLEDDPTGIGKRLKFVIKDILDNGGDYILFMSKGAGTQKGIENRIDKMDEACKSVGLGYKRQQFKVYDSNKIAEWASEYIATVAYVLEANGKSRPDIFRTWEQWGKDIQLSLSYKFQAAHVAHKITELKTLLAAETAVRVIGHSGIGKTRLIYEALRPDPTGADIIQNFLNASLVYYDYGLGQGSELMKYVLTFKENNVAVIVVDNCPNDMHAALAALVRHNSKIRIISIDFSLETEEKNLIKLTKVDQKQTVKLMLETLYPSYTGSEIEKLAELAEGYPKMVELLQEAVSKNGLSAITTQLPKPFIEKLVFGRQTPSPGEFDIIKSCAIFSEFNFIDDEIAELIGNQPKLEEYQTHRAFIAAEVCNPAISDEIFYRTCRNFKINRGIMERRGYTLTVVPTPLAANLAAQWILDYPPDKFQDFCKKLINVGLIDAFCKRLRSLDQIERAKTLVANLWGPKGPFVSAEVLNTEPGSRLFRSVVEVNPEATVQALVSIYGAFSVAEIKEVGHGRRNLIWALEKLVFRKETYEEAATILARFAAGENENLGNNATQQFLQTFHIFLPGTEASLNQRLSLIDYCIEEKEPQFISLGIEAISHSLKNHSFRRIGGAEEQGYSTKLSDYQPKTWDEIFAYWKNAIERLIRIVDEYPEKATHAKSAISSRIRALFGQNQGDILKLIITKLQALDNSLWMEAIKALRSTLKYEKLNTDNLKIVNELLVLLSPHDWANKLKYLVSVPDWDYSDPDIYNGQEKTTLNIRNLVREMASDNILPAHYLPQLVTGEQRRGVIMGKVLADEFPEQYATGRQIIDLLGELEPHRQSPEILAGFMLGAEHSIRERLINELLSDTRLNRHLFYILRFGNLKADEVFKLFPLINEAEQNILSFSNLIVQVGEGSLSIDDVISICNRLLTFGATGAWTAFTIYHQLSYSNESLWAAFKVPIRSILMKQNFILFEFQNRYIDLFSYSHVLQRMFSEQTDKRLANAVSAYLSESVNSKDFPSGNFQLQDLLIVLIKDYFDIVFKKLSPALLVSGIAYFNVKDLLGSHNGSHGHSGILFQGDLEKILQWCRDNSPKAPKRIAYMMPLFGNDSSKSLWHPFALIMINNFYQLPGFLEEISSNLGSFGWVGSTEPYFENLSQMMKELYNHPSMKVRKWAKAGYSHYQREIKLEIINEEQFRLKY